MEDIVVWVITGIVIVVVFLLYGKFLWRIEQEERVIKRARADQARRQPAIDKENASTVNAILHTFEDLDCEARRKGKSC